MKHRQSSLLEALRQTQVFLDAHADVIGPTIAASRRNLDDVVTQLTSYAAAQDSGTIGSRGETARQRALRAALRNNNMRPIAEVARQKLRDVPEFHALVMPPNNATSAQLVAHATAMGDAAAPHASVFTDVGMPADFLTSLSTAASDVAESIETRKQHAGKRSGATAGLGAAESRGRSMLRLIDALIVPRLQSNPALVAEWKSTRRVAKKPGPVGGGAAASASGGAPGAPTAATQAAA